MGRQGRVAPWSFSSQSRKNGFVWWAMPCGRFGDWSPFVSGHQLYNPFLKKRALATELSAHWSAPHSPCPEAQEPAQECQGCCAFKDEDFWSQLSLILAVFQISPFLRCLGWAWVNPRPKVSLFHLNSHQYKISSPCLYQLFWLPHTCTHWDEKALPSPQV